jgi:heptosyltransferase-1
VDAKHRAILDLVTVVDTVVTLERPTLTGWTDAMRRMRQNRYDAAFDLQGLLKSALLARASGAARVIGFSIWHLREKTARPFYSETGEEAPALASEHVIHKNLRLLGALGVEDCRITFPIARVESTVAAEVRAMVGEHRPFALINPGGAWPNKRWHPERFGEVAAFLRDVRGMASIVLWGPGEEALARAVADRSLGAARVAPRTSIADVLELSRQASLMLSGDTGPLHLAAAAGAPVVAIFGPTDPARNGPWSPDDITVSRFGSCGCHYERRCHREAWCLADVTVAEVTAAIQQRLSGARA